MFSVSPNNLEFTINADTNIEKVALIRNNAVPYEITVFPSTFVFTSGDDLKFTPTITEGYLLNGWVFNDGSVPVTTPALNMPNVSGNFTVTVTSKAAIP